VQHALALESNQPLKGANIHPVVADPPESKATSRVEDVVPELGTRLLHLQQERERCLNYAAALSGWSMFWKVSLIAVGALVAAQGAFAKVWGNASWITVTFIIFGVFTAAGTGFNSFFKPGERSPRFAEVGFEYERVERDIYGKAAALYRTVNLDIPDQRFKFYEAMDGILRRADERLDSVRKKELALYVTGPAKMGRQLGHNRKNRNLNH
jgi:hypothetical protein